MTNTPTDKEQPSGQTVRRILSAYASYTHVPKGLETPAEMSMEQAEAAINAYSMSVLEELKKHGDNYGVSDAGYGIAVPMSVIDAAIAKYKQGEKS